MSKESLEKHFPVGTPIALVDSHEACQYKLEVVEFVGNGVIGLNDEGKKIFIPWNSGLVLRERGECDCINCNPGKYEQPCVHDLLSFLDPDDNDQSAVESMISDLTGEKPVDESTFFDVAPLSESRWRNSKQ